jgi:galactose mutarotase-like enzyme
MRSGMVTGTLLVLVIAVLSAAYWEHGRGNLHKLKQKIATDRPEAPTYRPGGQDAILLTRTRLMGDSAPEFTSVTLLPGRGMNVLQITAFIPGHGEVGLLDAPSVKEASTRMTGTGEDAGGAASLAMGGAFEAPWAGHLMEGTHDPPSWRGRGLPLGTKQGEGGLLLAQAAVDSDVSAMPDGGLAQASYDLTSDATQWPSKARITVRVLLSSRSIDLSMTARNTGDTAEPVGLGWRPRFVFQGDRTHVRLRLPADTRLVTGQDGSPTGAVVPVTGSPYDFTSRQGVSLGSLALNDCFTGLRQDLLDSGPVAEVSYPSEELGLRLTSLTPSVKTMQVIAPADAHYLILEPRTNFPDPFGREWAKSGDTAIAVLQPGQTVEWKVRLEVFTPSGDGRTR